MNNPIRFSSPLLAAVLLTSIALPAHAGVSATTATATISIPTSAPLAIDGMYSILPDGTAYLHGWDDLPTSRPVEPKVLQTLPFSLLGSPSDRGQVFHVHENPLKSQPIDLPTSPAAFLFFAQARVAEDELPHLRIRLSDPQGEVPEAVLYDGYVQSLGRWRIVTPIPEEFRGRAAVVDLVTVNGINYNPIRAVTFDPVQIIEDTPLKTGSGLMD